MTLSPCRNKKARRKRNIRKKCLVRFVGIRVVDIYFCRGI